eukprot:CAMPEP_0171107940 /NCGR_PEP_ID=MMETSP0766_2-20121228/67830_1 /TAXON_ID=439317 /ORGANISM="Gambierdiscus australes, Strain CAWD 149" /LENGTH=72 /DNA_ID=CAMNT_0011569359 /DNA_START=28 /DNA_END=243 /DNA_ORIENTATION=+
MTFCARQARAVQRSKTTSRSSKLWSMSRGGPLKSGELPSSSRCSRGQDNEDRPCRPPASQTDHKPTEAAAVE